MSIAGDTTTEQLIAELARSEGPAEIVGGKIVVMSPTGDMPGRAAFAISMSLELYAKKTGGMVYGDNVAFLVDLPHRKSVSPDAAYYTGPRADMRFLPEPPIFAVEVRSENDYGPNAEKKIAAKRADYFAAGTQVVWDVDLLGADTVKVYRADAPENPTAYRKGDTAEAEPAVPGWKFAVSEMFD